MADPHDEVGATLQHGGKVERLGKAAFTEGDVARSECGAGEALGAMMISEREVGEATAGVIVGRVQAPVGAVTAGLSDDAAIDNAQACQGRPDATGKAG